MNRGLAALLGALVGSAVMTDPEHVILLNNAGPVPAVDWTDPEQQRNRGFNLILLDRRGQPAWYCKCRDARQERFAKSCALQEALAADARLTGHIPAGRSAADGMLRVHCSPFVSGKLLYQLLPKLNVQERAEAVSSAISTTELIAVHARGACQILAGSWERAVEEFNAGLLLLRREGVGSEAIAGLAAAVRRSPPLPAQIQHGDLWPANILRVGGRWLVLDFETFGDVAVPLYDAVQLLRSISDSRSQYRAQQEGWLASLRTDSAELIATQRILNGAASRSGLESRQVDAAVAFQLVDLAARSLRRGMAPVYREPIIREAKDAGLCLYGNQSLAGLLTGPG